MNSTPAEVDMPSNVLSKWQALVDLLAGIMKVPSALVVKIEPPNAKVLVSSDSKGNPFARDTRW